MGCRPVAVVIMHVHKYEYEMCPFFIYISQVFPRSFFVELFK